MTTTVVYSGTPDGQVACATSSAGYAACRNGTATKVVQAALAYFTVGQHYYYDPDYEEDQYAVYEGFLSFDTSGIDDGDTVSSSTLRLTSNADVSDTDFTLEVRSRDWGTALETTDFVAGADLSGLTLLASKTTASGWTAGTAYDFTDSAMPANVNKTGSTRMLVCSSRTTGNNTPTGNEYVQIYASEYTGTTSDPKLTVEHTSGGAPDITIDSGGGAFGWAAGGTLSEDFATSGGASFGWATDGTLYAQQAVWGNTFGWAPGGTIELIGNDRTISGGATFGWAPDGTAAETFITSGGATFGWAPNATLDAQTLTTELSGGATFGWAPGATLSEDFLATSAAAFGWGPSATLSEDFIATGASSFGWAPGGILAETFTASGGPVFGWTPAATLAETFITNGGAAFGWAPGGMLDATAVTFDLSGGAAFGWVSEAYIEIPVAPQDEGGRGPKRGRKTPFDDWTITMDDESILELYLLGKTR